MTVHLAWLGEGRHIGILETVGQLGPSVGIVGLLVHGRHHGVLQAAVVGPVVDMFK